MRYGLIPDNFWEWLALRSGRVPRPVLDGLFPLLQTRALMAATRLGLFEELADGALTATEVATRRNLDPESTRLVLRSLVPCGYIATRGDRFTLTPTSRRQLLAAAPGSLQPYLHWNYRHWEFMEHLEDLLRTGHGVDFHRGMTDPEDWRHYQESMMAVARLQAPTLARLVPVPRGARQLLDLGGSHGLYAATLCRKHPPMRATVLELPAAVPSARRLAEKAGHADIVDHREGDLERDDWGTGWDVILLSSILHHSTPTATRRILERAAAATSPGGSVAIWDYERPASDQPPHIGDTLALFFRLTSSATCHSGDEYATWLSGAGFERVRIQRPRTLPGTVLVHARRPTEV